MFSSLISMEVAILSLAFIECLSWAFNTETKEKGWDGGWITKIKPKNVFAFKDL